jgi:hypothetical protein
VSAALDHKNTVIARLVRATQFGGKREKKMGRPHKAGDDDFI